MIGFLTKAVLIKTYQNVRLHCPTIIGTFKFGVLPHFWQWIKSISNIGFACSDMALFWKIIFQPDGKMPLVTLNDQWEAILTYAWVKFYQLFGLASFNVGILIFRANVIKIGIRISLTLSKNPHYFSQDPVVPKFRTTIFEPFWHYIFGRDVEPSKILPHLLYLIPYHLIKKRRHEIIRIMSWPSLPIGLPVDILDIFKSDWTGIFLFYLLLNPFRDLFCFIAYCTYYCKLFWSFYRFEKIFSRVWERTISG